MKKILSLLKGCLLLAGSAALVSSCQDYEPFSEKQIQDVAYTREFERKFGEIDPNQNWDLFGQLAKGVRHSYTRATDANGVTVDNPAIGLPDPANGQPMEVITSTLEDSQEYRKVMPESNVNVIDQGNDYDKTNLSRVTTDFVTTAKEFALWPVYYYTSGNDELGIYWYVDEDTPGAKQVTDYNTGQHLWILESPIFTSGSFTQNIKGYKVDAGSYSAVNYNANFWTELSTRFPDDYHVATVNDKDRYGNTLSGNVFKAGIQSDGTTPYYQAFPTTWQNDWPEVGDGKVIPTKIAEDLAKIHPEFVLTPGDGTGTYPNPWNGEWSNSNKWLLELKATRTDAQQGNPRNSSEGWFGDSNIPATIIESTPVKVTIPEDVPFVGFYINNTNHGSVYSESKLNPTYLFERGRKTGDVPVSYVSTFDIHEIDETQESKRFLCFEDWYPQNGSGGSDFDLNDIVFTVTGIDPSSVIDREKTEESAILVCEDLSKFDFDFNDVVLRLDYVDGVTRKYELDVNGNVTNVIVTPSNRELTVTAMAAGGAYESEIYINGTKWGEIHDLMGNGDATDPRKHAIINAAATYGGDGSSMTIKDEYDANGTLITKNLPDKDASYPTFLSQLFAKDDVPFFKIMCDNGELKEEDKGQEPASRIVQSGSYSEGSAPQMMLLPYYFEWPQEMEYIYDAYEDFAAWVQNIEATNWIITSQIEKLITNRGDFASETNTISELVSSSELPWTNNQTFTYKDKNGKETTYSNCAKIDFTNVTANTDEFAFLTVTFTAKPSSGRTYLDFADGTQIMEDNQLDEVRVFKLSKNQLQQAISTKAIYIMGQGNQTVSISKAVLTIRK